MELEQSDICRGKRNQQASYGVQPVKWVAGYQCHFGYAFLQLLVSILPDMRVVGANMT